MYTQCERPGPTPGVGQVGLQPEGTVRGDPTEGDHRGLRPLCNSGSNL